MKKIIRNLLSVLLFNQKKKKMKQKPLFYGSTNLKGEKTIITADKLSSMLGNFKPISIESVIRYYKLAYGLEVFILPCWNKSNNDDSLILSGYTYSITKSKHFSHSLWNMVILNNLTPQNDSENAKELDKVTPCFPSQELALVEAVKYINKRENRHFFHNDGYTYSGDNGFSLRRIPHYTPFVVMTDDDVNIVELFSFDKNTQRYHSVSDKHKYIEIDLDGNHFIIVNSTENSWVNHIVFPIDNEEYVDYLYKQFVSQDE